MTTDSNTDEFKGRVKEATGAVTDDEDLKKEGKADQKAADAKSKVESAADSVKDKVDDVKSRVKDG